MSNKVKDPALTPPSGIVDRRPVIVAGLGRLGVRLVQLLLEQGHQVRVITESGCPAWHVRSAREAGAELYTGDFRDPEVWTAAGVLECQAAAITSAEDSRNLETSIRVKRMAPQLRMVTRVDAPHLGHRLQRDFDLHAALCPADLSAAQFVKTALDASPLEVPLGRPRQPSSRRKSSLLKFVLVLLAACLITGTLVFHFVKGLPWVDATYFTVSILTTVGFGDYHLQQDAALIKGFGMILMLAGITLIALLVSLFSHFLTTGEATRQQQERAARHLRRHVIVAGMGSLGFAVLKELQERGIPAVCIELDRRRMDAMPPVQGVPVIEGDATWAEILLRAGIDRARAVLAVTSSDGTNLEIALRARTLTDQRRPHAPLPVIISCQDELLAARLSAASPTYLPLSSAEIAAPVFAGATLNEALETSRPALG